MLEYLRRRREDEQGFTLIELMVVVLIIAILIAIAIPTFLGAQDRARDRGAQSDLRNTLTAARTIATDFEGYFKTGTDCATDPIDSSALEEEETAIEVQDTLAPTNNEVGVEVSTDCETLALKRESTSETWFGLKATKDGDVTYCREDEASGFTAVGGTCNDESW